MTSEGERMPRREGHSLAFVHAVGVRDYGVRPSCGLQLEREAEIGGVVAERGEF